MHLRTIADYPWTEEDVELLRKACELNRTNLPKDPRVDPTWTDQECELVINALEKQLTEIGGFLEAVDGSSPNDLIKHQRYLYNKYKELYDVFALEPSPQP